MNQLEIKRNKLNCDFDDEIAEKRGDTTTDSIELMWDFNRNIKIIQRLETDKPGEPTRIP